MTVEMIAFLSGLIVLMLYAYKDRKCIRKLEAKGVKLCHDRASAMNTLSKISGDVSKTKQEHRELNIKYENANGHLGKALRRVTELESSMAGYEECKRRLNELLGERNVLRRKCDSSDTVITGLKAELATESKMRLEAVLESDALLAQLVDIYEGLHKSLGVADGDEI